MITPEERAILESAGIDPDRLDDQEYLTAQSIRAGSVSGVSTEVLEALAALAAARKTGCKVAGIDLTANDVAVLMRVFERDE